MPRPTNRRRETEDRVLSWIEDDAILIGRDDVSDFNEENILPHSPDIQESIREWLMPTSYNAENGEYRKHLASHLRGTGEWLLSSSALHELQHSDQQGMLWIKGIPGSGKSVIAASLIERLSKETPTLYFFFRQIIEANHKPVALLRDWLAQVLVYSPPLQAKLKEHLDEKRTLNSVSLSDMWRDLRMAILYLPRVYLVVDALDEMDSGNEEFLRALADLGRWRPSRVKIIITSRPIASFERPLRLERMLHIRLEERFVDVDIANYVQHRLRESSISCANYSMIRKAVPGRASGMFLYAKLAMDAFLEQGADPQVVLKTLPTDLSVMYAGLLHEHARRSGVSDELQLLILSWVTHATRPLRLLEMAEMIKVNTDESSNLKAIKDLVRAACGPLLEILPDETVCVIHHSFTEFLNGSTRAQGKTGTLASSTDSYSVLDMGSTHNRLALACLRYMRSGCLDDVQLVSDDDYETDSEWGNRYYRQNPANRELHMRYPFLAYSLENWHIHAQKADRGGQDLQELLDFTGKLFAGRDYLAFVTLTEGEAHERTPLHIAAKLGLSQYVARLLSNGEMDVDLTDSFGRTAIFHAAQAGSTEVVRLLLANGAKPDEPSTRDGHKPLHRAASNDHGEIVSLLLAAGVDPLTQKTLPDPCIICGDPTKTPLMYAFENGRESAAKAFLPYIKDSATVSRALCWAAGRGHLGIILATLEHPLVDVNATARSQTPLFLAAKKPYVKSMMALLQAGANPSALSDWAGEQFGSKGRKVQTENANRGDYTALHALCGAIRNKHRNFYADSNNDDFQELELLQECMSLMVQRGVDINAKDKLGMTALHYASNWWPTLVRLLLAAGADAAISAPDGSTPLHGCFDPDIARILVEEGGADLERQRESDGKTPFLSIATNCSSDLVQRYADLGANLNATDYSGRGALHILLGSWTSQRDVAAKLKSLDTLLAAGVSPSTQNKEGKTPMHLLCNGLAEDFEIVLRLVTAGADLNVRDNQGYTPIFSFVREAAKHTLRDNVTSVIDRLVERGAHLDDVDYEGKNLLFACIATNCVGFSGFGLVRELVKRGVDAKATDHDGNTLLHYIMMLPEGSSHGKYLTGLQDLGVDESQQNNAGQSPLHFILGPRCEPFRSFGSFKHMDIKDKHGIRPIHLAAKFSEVYVAQLLVAGACPMDPTEEGVTPLHVAARFRQPNIVGMLLEAIETKVGKGGVSRHLNAFPEPKTPTALHLACRSGLAETVEILLRAGADPNSTSQDISRPLWWCTQYEAEEALWAATKSKYLAGKKNLPATELIVSSAKDSLRGIRVSDLTRDIVSAKGTSTRLEDILGLLRAYGADMVTSKNKDGLTNLDVAIMDCGENDYTAECLLRMRLQLEEEGSSGTFAGDAAPQLAELVMYLDRILQENENSTSWSIHNVAASVHRRAATRRAFIETQPWSKIGWGESSYQDIERLLDELLHMHDWESVKHMLRQGPKLYEVEQKHESLLQKFVSEGYDDLLRDLVTHEDFQQMEQEREVGLRSGEPSIRPSLSSHPLVTACERPSGNMAMLRCLVNDLGADVNAQYLTWSYYEKGPKKYKSLKSALEVLASGNHWWQVAEGLPYLISRGADLEVRDVLGRTPLLWAMSHCGPYQRRVVELLLELGADINATDMDGKNPLAYVGRDIDMARLLISRGVTVTAASLFKAISYFNAPVIEVILSAGANANMRRQAHELNVERQAMSPELAPAEVYPVYYAAGTSSGMAPGMEHQQKENMEDRHFPVIRTLLRSGADPFAKFTRFSRSNHTEKVESREECLVLHDILRQGYIVEPFFELPDLDIERRDPKGRTLILAAARSFLNPDLGIDDVYYRLTDQKLLLSAARTRERDKPTAIEWLLAKGACVTARDYDQKNALHHILDVQSSNGYSSLKLLISRAPELIHQTDSAGETPLHYALRRVSAQRYSRLDTKAVDILLRAGADPHLPDVEGNTALHHLAKWLTHKGWMLGEDKSWVLGEERKPRQLFQKLVSSGLPIDGRNKEGETPIFSFMKSQGRYIKDLEQIKGEEERQLAALQMFADAGADFFVLDNAGQSLLHVVAATDKKEFGFLYRTAAPAMLERFRWLLERGLDPLAEDAEGRTCLDIAAVKENEVILNCFKRQP